jgi:hypothetical protein
MVLYAHVHAYKMSDVSGLHNDEHLLIVHIFFHIPYYMRHI